jgi:agmatine deiminase
MEPVRDIWVEMIRAISPGEKVRLLVNDEASAAEATRRLKAARVDMDRVLLCRIPTVDVWIRDYGPTFLTGGAQENSIALDWTFNAWGGKYEAYVKDDRVAREIAGSLDVSVFKPGIVLEGGSIDVNGSGTCLVTEQCLLSPTRNPDLGKREIEQVLANCLGVDHFIWLGQGIAGDDTDGHIDNLARFVNPSTVVCAIEGDTGDENCAPLSENYERLQGARDQKGERLTVVPLPLPGRVEYEGTRLPASYANFFIANEAVLVPIYNQPNDRIALGILAELFPQRKVIGIPCGSLLYGLGAIHCVTQQQPAS